MKNSESYYLIQFFTQHFVFQAFCCKITIYTSLSLLSSQFSLFKIINSLMITMQFLSFFFLPPLNYLKEDQEIIINET